MSGYLAYEQVFDCRAGRTNICSVPRVLSVLSGSSQKVLDKRPPIVQDRDMASNRFPTYCIDCDRQVGAGHAPLLKAKGRWVVACRNLSTIPTYGSDDGYDAIKDRMLEGGW